MNRLIFFVFILFLSISNITSEELLPKIMFIDAEPGLRMRDKPDLNGKKITTIPYKSKVIVKEEESEELTISGKKGKWSFIKYQDLEGWVFNGFLVDIIPLPLQNKDQLYDTWNYNCNRYLKINSDGSCLDTMPEMYSKSGSWVFDMKTKKLIVNLSYEGYEGTITEQYIITINKFGDGAFIADFYLEFEDGTLSNEKNLLFIKSDIPKSKY